MCSVLCYNDVLEKIVCNVDTLPYYEITASRIANNSMINTSLHAYFVHYLLLSMFSYSAWFLSQSKDFLFDACLNAIFVCAASSA